MNQKELKELLGDSYMIEQDYDNSVRQYREVLAKDPRDLKARVSLADILSWQKKYDEAVAEYLTALEINPDDLATNKKLATVYVVHLGSPKFRRTYNSPG
ncbi:MAG: tetratricopeptide repeat protein [bacterium]